MGRADLIGNAGSTSCPPTSRSAPAVARGQAQAEGGRRHEARAALPHAAHGPAARADARGSAQAALNTRRLRRLLFEALVVVAIVAGVQAWRARDLLPAGERIAAPPFELEDSKAGRGARPASRQDHGALFLRALVRRVRREFAAAALVRPLAGDDVQIVMVDSTGRAPTSSRDTPPATSSRCRSSRAGRKPPPTTASAATRLLRDRPQRRIARRDMGYTTAPGLWLRTRGSEPHQMMG